MEHGVAAGWYSDPWEPTQLRYWDGSQWTSHASPSGQAEPEGLAAPGGAVAPGPGAEPGGPPPANDAGRAFNQALLHGLVLGIVAGLASGTAAAPVLGTVVGAVVGAVLALPVALLAAWVISAPLRTPGRETAFLRRLDVTLVVLGVATAALAVGWISLEALVGPWPALAMLVVVVAGLVAVRFRLRRLVPAP